MYKKKVYLNIIKKEKGSTLARGGSERMTQFDQNELEQTRIAIRYFLQQITNDDFNALCIIENKGLR